MQEASETIADDTDPARRWTEHVSWGAMLALGWMIYELTARPAYGIAFACAKFGWNDFLTAHWLLRRDPERPRGRTCFFFYVASGLWKATVAAFLMTGGILGIAVLLGQKPPRGLLHLGLAALVGITLLAIIPFLGVALAHFYGVRVWIDSTVHQSRREDVWPPSGTTGCNLASNLLFPAMVVPLITTALTTFRLGPWAMLLLMFGEGLLIWRFFRGVAAHSPRECWEDAFVLSGAGDAEEDLDDESEDQQDERVGRTE